ncbi:hypothetical protein PIB30_080665 [Stylosanthes scabra]|uniref:Uncharacterized protein n=1 Tax=Stylosanthes scabra TaxID=79078 RepID=A0ABU6QR29_9FABA|nr:hypothetical protein [Stylosanthes scabra]
MSEILLGISKLPLASAPDRIKRKKRSPSHHHDHRCHSHHRPISISSTSRLRGYNLASVFPLHRSCNLWRGVFRVVPVAVALTCSSVPVLVRFKPRRGRRFVLQHHFFLALPYSVPYTMAKFDIEDTEAIRQMILANANVAYRSWRSRLHEHYELYNSDEERL